MRKDLSLLSLPVAFRFNRNPVSNWRFALATTILAPVFYKTSSEDSMRAIRPWARSSRFKRSQEFRAGPGRAPLALRDVSA
jgi:hypothetical protein